MIVLREIMSRMMTCLTGGHVLWEGMFYGMEVHYLYHVCFITEVSVNVCIFV